ncbi:hypothetical protein SteCoe_5813 [Stentor coeruleus]|uniref:IMS import disulfide relay-system CHCH-CHCH-like Cx9C domain-containing protein n=1 Tax=Stentor coeruleus TaxID=5963 RepID=A0A1R2CRC6_9CILI|nr:hypothetical protein SteCoe_5813 [Stentor coeruleus]
MCDKIKEGDTRYDNVRGTVQKTGCIEYHDMLEKCLKAHHKDWRKCQEQVVELRKCMDVLKEKTNPNP